MDWEEYISEIASDIMKEQSPKRFVFDAVYSFLIFHGINKMFHWTLKLSVLQISYPIVYCCQRISCFSYLRAMNILSAVCFRLFQVRGKLYELLINCIPPEIILKVNLLLYNVPTLRFFSLPDFDFIFVGSEASLWAVEETGCRTKTWNLPLGCLLCKCIINKLFSYQQLEYIYDNVFCMNSSLLYCFTKFVDFSKSAVYFWCISIHLLLFLHRFRVKRERLLGSHY